MKKNSKNKKVIMALTMAINASMILNPVLAKAESLGDAPNSLDDNTVPVTPLKPTNEQKNAAATATNDALSAAKDAKEKTVETVSAEEGYEKTVSGVAPAAEAVKEINENLFKESADDAVEQINGVISDLDKATLSEIVAGSADRLASGAAIDANKAGADVDKYAAEYEKQVNALSEKIVGVAETINNSNDAIDKASTKEEANKAAQAARDAYAGLADIEKDITDAETNYNGALSDYNTAKDKYDTAVAAYNQAKADYDELTGAAATGAAVTAEDLSNISDDLEALKSQAEDNKKKLEGLEIIKTAEDNIVANPKSVDFATNAEKGKGKSVTVDGHKGTEYTKELNIKDIAEIKTGKDITYADYFNKIVAFYYTDEILGGEFDKLEWHRYNISKFSYTDENDVTINKGNKGDLGGGDVLNYCAVSYHVYLKDDAGNYILDDDGNKIREDKVAYLNYKLANNNQTGKDYHGIVIFEKTGHYVLEGKDIKVAELETLENGSVVVDKDENGNETRILAETENGIAKFDVTKSIETKNYDDNMVLSDETDEDGVRTVKEVAEDSEEKVSYEYSDGKVTKSVEKGIIVTTYTNETLAAPDKYAVTEDEAKEAFANALTDKLNLLNDGESLIIRVGENDVEVAKGTTITKDNAADYGYVKAEDNEAEGVYKVSGTFTKSVVVSGNASEENTLKAKYNYGDSLFDWQHATKLVDNDAVVVNGNTVTVEYENLNSIKVPSGVLSFIEDLLNINKSEEEIREILKDNNITLPEGSVIFAYDAVNGDAGTATIYYVEGNSCDMNIAVEGENPSDDDIKEAVKSALAGDDDSLRINNLNVEIGHGTTYGYQELAYILKKVNSDKAIISTEVFETVEKMAELERRNDNWYTGDFGLVTQEFEGNDPKTTKRDVKTDIANPTFDNLNFWLTDDQAETTADFRKAIDSAADEAANYADLLNKIAAADKLVSDASAEVDALSAQIKGLSLKDIDAKVNALTKNLDAAKEKLAAANLKKAELEKALKETENKLAKKISELNTPPYYPNTNDDTNKEEDNKKEEDSKEETKEETAEQTLTVTEDETAQGSANVSDSKDKKEGKKTKKDKASNDKASEIDLGGEDKQALGGAVVRDTEETAGNEASQIEVDEDKETALGEAVTTDDDKDAKDEATAAKKETEKETGSKVDITEDETPEGAADSVDTVKPNFWWLLLILILGATGEEMYRRHRNKKKAAKEKVKNV